MKALFFRTKFKKFLLIMAALFTGFLIILGGLLVYLNSLFTAPDVPGKGKNIIINIPTSANAEKISNILYKQGLIKSPQIFRIYAHYTGVDGKFKAGEYSINTASSLPQTVNLLIKGPPTYAVTIPEGYTIRQVADLLVNKGFVKREDFYETLAKENFSYPFLQNLGSGNTRLEGYLFPDTYVLRKPSESKLIIGMMLDRFNKEINNLDYQKRAENMGLTLHEAVTIASMIEKEAKYDRERPIIAGVIFNRLRLGMPLQIDATVQYALGSNRSKLYYKDLETDSPYNTYRVNGLPPGPIASPGKASLLAVVNPQKTDYLYYVAKPDGTHVFAKTLAEHNKNVMKYIR